MKMEFKKASKKQSKLRCAIFGPSGSGKTFSALSIASGMSKKVAVIDTERGSASKYADRFEFDVVDLPNHAVETYIAAINAANRAGYEVLIIDSLSHAWQSILDEVDKLAKGKYKGNSWSAWSEGTPIQKRMVDALLGYNGHIIGTMRSKTEWITEPTQNGKSKPVRVGLSPEQGKGIEYEFDLLIEISVDHIAEVIKDRTGKFQDKSFSKPGQEFGIQLLEWLNEGEAEINKEIKIATPEQISQLEFLCEYLEISKEKIQERITKNKFKSIHDVTYDVLNKWINELLEKKALKKEENNGA